MIRTALRSLLARKLRMLLTGLVVTGEAVPGAAFFSVRCWAPRWREASVETASHS